MALLLLMFAIVALAVVVVAAFRPRLQDEPVRVRIDSMPRARRRR